MSTLIRPSLARAVKSTFGHHKRLYWCDQRCRHSHVSENLVQGCQANSGRAQFDGGCGSAQFTYNKELDALSSSTEAIGRWRAEANQIRSRLRSYGVSGLLAYGLLNTLYYSGAFFVIWTYIAKVPRGLGWAETTKQFATVMSLTWAASQITKVPRAALALVMAPTADGLLIFVQARCRLRTRRNAFAFMVGVCLLLACSILGGTLLIWA